MEEDEPEPGVEKVEELECERERERERERCLLSRNTNLFFLIKQTWTGRPDSQLELLMQQNRKSKHALSVVADTCSGRLHLKL